MLVNKTLNAGVNINAFGHLACAGKLCSVSHRFGALANNSVAHFLIDARSMWFTMQLEVSVAGDYEANLWLVNSYSAGSSPTISNRNLLFHGVGSVTSVLLVQPTVELMTNSANNLIEERFIPGGSKPFKVGGSFGGEQPIFVNPGTIMMWEFANRSGGASNIDFLAVGFEGHINSGDWTGK